MLSVLNRPRSERREISFVKRIIAESNLDLVEQSLWESEKPISELTCLNQRIEDAYSEYLQVKGRVRVVIDNYLQFFFLLLGFALQSISV